MNRNLWYDLPNARCKMLYKCKKKKTPATTTTNSIYSIFSYMYNIKYMRKRSKYTTRIPFCDKQSILCTNALKYIETENSDQWMYGRGDQSG